VRRLTRRGSGPRRRGSLNGPDSLKQFLLRRDFVTKYARGSSFSKKAASPDPAEVQPRTVTWASEPSRRNLNKVPTDRSEFNGPPMLCAFGNETSLPPLDAGRASVRCFLRGASGWQYHCRRGTAFRHVHTSACVVLSNWNFSDHFVAQRIDGKRAIFTVL